MGSGGMRGPHRHVSAESPDAHVATQQAARDPYLAPVGECPLSQAIPKLIISGDRFGARTRGNESPR